MDRDEVVDITREVQEFVRESGKKDGAVLVFSVGSTGAITTLEYEPGLKKDLPRMMDKLAPYGEHYEHHGTWNDDNGSSHVKSAVIGTSLIVPFSDGRLVLGTWQQIVLINFDTRRRKRKVALHIL
ncbi:YjbQ family protein [Geoglobus acetivorans]|nr:YjbQ family protein [Geoglobus acetivorans]